MDHSFLVHNADDVVGVAVTDIKPGERVHGRVQTDDQQLDMEPVDRIPLGHKIALRDIAKGEQVIKYGTPIGRASADIRTGQHVHVHNLKGERWA